MRVQLAGYSDANRYARLVVESAHESGVALPIFSPARAGDYDADEIAADARCAWDRSFHEPGWSRSWLLEDTTRAIGTLTLRGPDLRNRLHRATVMIVIRASHVGRRLGDSLLEQALAFANSAALEYLDAEVLSSNARAVRFFERWGFVCWGRWEGALRHSDSHYIDELRFSRRLGRPSE